MEFNWDELNIGNFRFDEFHSEPSEFLSSELHSPKKRSDGKGYDFGLDDEIRTDMDSFDEEKVLAKVEEYFEPMDIPKERKRERVKKTMECWDDFMFMLYWIDLMREKEVPIDWEKIFKECYKRITNIFGEYKSTGTKIAIGSDASDFVDVTKRHLGEAYYTSADRAINVAISIVSDVENCIDYEKDSVGKKYKVWHTIRDGKERVTHAVMDGVTIPIGDQFSVGDSIMDYPRDLTYEPSMEEIANCRCWLTYR